MRCASGEYIRAWVSVRGLQPPKSASQPQDCLFVGTLCYMQSATKAGKERRVCTRVSLCVCDSPVSDELTNGHLCHHIFRT